MRLQAPIDQGGHGGAGAVIALYLQRQVFPAGREEEEARILWAALRREASQSTPPFDAAWFATLRPAAPEAPAGPGAVPVTVASVFLRR